MKEQENSDQWVERIVLEDIEETDQPVDDIKVFEIIGDRKLSYEDRSVDIKPDAVALNGLLKVRGKWVNGHELRDAMQTTLAAPLISTRLSRLAADLKALSGGEDDILEKRGPRNAQEYRLSPLVGFRDVRAELDSLAARGAL